MPLLKPPSYQPMGDRPYGRLYFLSKDDDSVVKQIFLMSLDFHFSGKSSCYSSLLRISKFYDLPDFDPLLVTDKINHYLKLMHQQYVLHWQHTLQYSKKLEFCNTFLNVLKD